MDCVKCDGTYIEKTDTYTIMDPYVGKITINGVSYYQCDMCEDTLYSEAMTQAIELERNNRIEEILKRSPIKDFVNSTETALMLGISRQALHKNRRINHGFIFYTKFGGSNVYLKQSVLNYMKSGDGRFPLYRQSLNPYTTYFVESLPTRTTSIYMNPIETHKTISVFTKTIQVGQKERNYA